MRKSLVGRKYHAATVPIFAHLKSDEPDKGAFCVLRCVCVCVCWEKEIVCMSIALTTHTHAHHTSHITHTHTTHISDTYVTAESGTGVVHQAPGFERTTLQYDVMRKGDTVVCPVDTSGNFTT